MITNYSASDLRVDACAPTVTSPVPLHLAQHPSSAQSSQSTRRSYLTSQPLPPHSGHHARCSPFSIWLKPAQRAQVSTVTATSTALSPLQAGQTPVPAQFGQTDISLVATLHSHNKGVRRRDNHRLAGCQVWPLVSARIGSGPLAEPIIGTASGPGALSASTSSAGVRSPVQLIRRGALKVCSSNPRSPYSLAIRGVAWFDSTTGP